MIFVLFWLESKNECKLLENRLHTLKFIRNYADSIHHDDYLNTNYKNLRFDNSVQYLDLVFFAIWKIFCLIQRMLSFVKRKIEINLRHIEPKSGEKDLIVWEFCSCSTFFSK